MRLSTVLAGVLVAGVTLTACSVNTELDEAAVVYMGAMGAATKFVKCIAPGKRDDVDATHNTWTYPAGQQTFTMNEGGDAGPLTVVSKDNVELVVPAQVTFALNISCPVLQQFHERIGRKNHAYLYGTGIEESQQSDEGWRKVLAFYLKAPLDRAMDAAAQEFGWQKLYNDPPTKQAWEKRVGELAAKFMVETGGGQFFCQPLFAGAGDCGSITLTIQKPQPPAGHVAALGQAEANRVANAAQKELNAKITTELSAIRDLVKELGPLGTVLWRAVEKNQQLPPLGYNVQPPAK